MPEHARYDGLRRELSAIGVLKRAVVRCLPDDCPAGPAAVLTVLRRDGVMRLSRLAELLSLDVSVTSRHVTHAVAQGWVERTRDPADGRSAIIDLTSAGLDVLDEISARSNQMLVDRMSDWSTEEIADLTVLLARLRESFADCRHPAAPLATTGT